MSTSRLHHVDAMRGVAALAVVWFHLTGSTGLSESTAALGRYGYLGVEVFFVISGFIIPYSMARRSYQTREIGTFLLKRIVRLDPPYLVAIALAVALPALTMGDGFVPPTPARLLAHLGYANAFVGLDWLSPVFWTLAVEFQFYLFMSVAFWLVGHERDIVALPFLTACALAPFAVSSEAFLPHWAGLFVVGALAFRWTSYQSPVLGLVAVGVVAAATTWTVDGLPEALAGACAVLVVLFGRLPESSRAARVLLWFGAISYSLYLTHWTIGVTGVAVARHLPALGGFEMFRVAVGILVAVVSAWVLYLSVERPAIEWANRVGHRQRTLPTPQPVPEISEAEVW